MGSRPRFFFFQAEDGIRDVAVTGVQTCALPICPRYARPPSRRSMPPRGAGARTMETPSIGSDGPGTRDRKSTRLNSSHGYISYAVFCLKKKKNTTKKLVDVFHACERETLV